MAKFKIEFDIDTDAENAVPVLETVSNTIREELIEKIPNIKVFPTVTVLESDKEEDNSGK